MSAAGLAAEFFADTPDVCPDLVLAVTTALASVAATADDPVRAAHEFLAGPVFRLVDRHELHHLCTTVS